MQQHRVKIISPDAIALSGAGRCRAGGRATAQNDVQCAAAPSHAACVPAFASAGAAAGVVTVSGQPVGEAASAVLLVAIAFV